MQDFYLLIRRAEIKRRDKTYRWGMLGNSICTLLVEKQIVGAFVESRLVMHIYIYLENTYPSIQQIDYWESFT